MSDDNKLFLMCRNDNICPEAVDYKNRRLIIPYLRAKYSETKSAELSINFFNYFGSIFDFKMMKQIERNIPQFRAKIKNCGFANAFAKNGNIKMLAIVIKDFPYVPLRNIFFESIKENRPDLFEFIRTTRLCPKINDHDILIDLVQKKYFAMLSLIIKTYDVTILLLKVRDHFIEIGDFNTLLDISKCIGQVSELKLGDLSVNVSERNLFGIPNIFSPDELFQCAVNRNYKPLVDFCIEVGVIPSEKIFDTLIMERAIDMLEILHNAGFLNHFNPVSLVKMYVESNTPLVCFNNYYHKLSTVDQMRVFIKKTFGDTYLKTLNKQQFIDLFDEIYVWSQRLHINPEYAIEKDDNPDDYICLKNKFKDFIDGLFD
jgi:hypothetical protein